MDGDTSGKRQVIAAGMARLSQGLSVLVAILACSVLAGYVIRSEPLVSIAPTLQGMSPLTAFALLLLALSCLARISKSDRSGKEQIASLGLAALIALAILVAHIGFGSDIISRQAVIHIFGWSPQVAGLPYGQTSVATAVCILILTVAIWYRSRPDVSDKAVGLVLLISGMAILGYIYGVHELYAVPIFDTIAIHTALGLFLLALAILFCRQDSGWSAIIADDSEAGAKVRRQMGFILLPPAIAWFLMRLTHASDVGPEAATTFLVAIILVPLVILILREGRTSLVLEKERRERTGLQLFQASELKKQLSLQAAQLRRQNQERQKAEEVMFHAQRMDTIGQLTGGIAHDFNNLLMAISGNMELLKKRLPADPLAGKFIDNLSTAVVKGKKLTGQLLAFSRTQKLDIRPVCLDKSLHNARDMIGSALGPAIEVTFKSPPETLWTLTDPDQFELAILNLAINARDAMPDGGLLTIESATFTAGSVDGLGNLYIRVIDTGQGMSPEVAARATEPFFTTKEPGKGTGLGLAQVYGLIKQCKGDLEIKSRVGHGTTVELRLPRIPCPAVEELPASATLSDFSTSRSTEASLPLLIVDDDDDVRSVLVEGLLQEGFEVIEADSGKGGLLHLETHKPALAIVDFIMPGMNGAEFALQAQAAYPGLPIIFISGYSDTVALDGISGALVLRKPFKLETLVHAISSCQGASCRDETTHDRTA